MAFPAPAATARKQVQLAMEQYACSVEIGQKSAFSMHHDVNLMQLCPLEIACFLVPVKLLAHAVTLLIWWAYPGRRLPAPFTPGVLPPFSAKQPVGALSLVGHHVHRLRLQLPQDCSVRTSNWGIGGFLVALRGDIPCLYRAFRPRSAACP